MQKDKNALNIFHICGIALCAIVIFFISLSDDDEARSFMLLVQISVLICAIYALVPAFRARGATLLFKILTLVNILICLNTEIYRGTVLFWATVSTPIALYLIFLYLLSKLALYLANRKNTE